MARGGPQSFRAGRAGEERSGSFWRQRTDRFVARAQERYAAGTPAEIVRCWQAPLRGKAQETSSPFWEAVGRMASGVPACKDARGVGFLTPSRQIVQGAITASR